MKKYLIVLLLAIFIMPFSVFAIELDPYFNEETANSTEDVKEKELKYRVTLDREISLKENNIVITFTVGEDVKFISSKLNVNGYTLKREGNVVTIMSNNGDILKSGDTIELGTYVYSYINEMGLDCEFKGKVEFVKIEEVKNPENPQTGISMPMIAVGTLGLIAVGLYVSTKNKNKIYNV